MHVRAYWEILVRGWWILALVIGGTGGAAYLLSSAQSPTFESTTKILVQGGRDAGGGAADLRINQRLAEAYTDLVTTRPINEEVQKILGLSGDAIKISVSSRRSLLEITAASSDPEQAALIANTTATVFIDAVRRRQFTEIAQLQASLSQFGIDQDAGLISAQAAVLTALSVVEEAFPRSRASTPRVTQDVSLALLLGLLLGGLILLLRNTLDDRITTQEEIRTLGGTRSSGLVTIGSVFRYSKADSGAPLLIKGDARKELIEAFKFLHTNLEFAAVEEPAFCSVLVTSSIPEEGKTTTAINLAASIAREGQNVILIDADLRRPDLHKIFNLEGRKGLTHLLLRKATVDEVLAPTDIESLLVIPAGPLPPDPPQMLRSSRMSEVLSELKERSDWVILDSPPLLAVTDPMLIASSVDGVLLVVDVRRTRRSSLRRSIEMLRWRDPKLLVTVLNKVAMDRGRGYASYGYYDYGDREASQNGAHEGLLTRAFSRIRNIRLRRPR